VHRILVPADVYPIAPSGEQNAPACTIGPGFPGGWVVFGGAGGFVVVFAGAGFFVVTAGAGTVVGTSTVAAGVTAAGDGLGESLGLALADGAVPTRLFDFAAESGPQAVRTSTAKTATATRCKAIRRSCSRYCRNGIGGAAGAPPTSAADSASKTSPPAWFTGWCEHATRPRCGRVGR
jgi:hypothetical protein